MDNLFYYEKTKSLKMSKHKFYRIDNRYIIPYFSEKLRFRPDNSNSFNTNSLYSLSGVSCDGFEMPSKKYKFISYIGNVNGIDLDSVVMKQVDGEQTSIFSLTKNDCRNLGIEFESGLQIFPKSLNWVELVQEEKMEFDSMNLSTYPVDYNDGTIHRMTFKISNLSYDSETHTIIMQDGTRISEANFINGLTIAPREKIGSATDLNHAYIKIGYNIDKNIVTRALSRIEGNCLNIDVEGCMFVELYFCSKYNMTYGIKPKYFKNKSFEDLFRVFVSYDEEVELPIRDIPTWKSSLIGTQMHSTMFAYEILRRSKQIVDRMNKQNSNFKYFFR